MIKKLGRALIAYAIYCAAHTMIDPTHAMAQADAMPLAQAEVFNSPRDIAGWDKSVTIKSVSVDPSFGLKVDTTAIPDAWNAHVKGWGDGDNIACGTPGVDDGCIQYTVWLVANVNGKLATSGFIQMWKGRASTGAFETSGGWATEFPKNWAYDSRWGTLAGYSPQPSAQLGVFISAGDARGRGEVHSVAQRSNVVAIPAAFGTFAGGAAADVPNHQSVVETAKQDLLRAGKDLSGPCGAFAITKLAAWRLRNEGAGLLSKPSGNNCDSYAVDIIIYPDGTAFDVLTDGGGANGPAWGRIDPIDASRYRPAVDPQFVGGGTSEPPAPPQVPVDLGPLVARIAAAEAQNEVLRQALEALTNSLNATTANLIERIEGTEKATQRIDGYLATRPIPVSCKASLFGFGVSCSLQQ